MQDVYWSENHIKMDLLELLNNISQMINSKKKEF